MGAALYSYVPAERQEKRAKTPFETKGGAYRKQQETRQQRLSHDLTRAYKQRIVKRPGPLSNGICLENNNPALKGRGIFVGVEIY